MKNYQKYSRSYFMPPERSMKWVEKEYIEKAPDWCSVDLRDGNQALIIPMSLEEKLDFFKFLVKIGFKEIEVGFPAASDTEFEFCRRIIEDDLIPDDVSIQVLTQAREHIIRRTFEALRGCKNAVVHMYNSTSVAQREQVFKKSKDEIIEIAKFGANLLKECSEEYDGNFRFQYSPESFTGTEIDFALEICNAVIDIWEPTPQKKVIINLPVTVQVSMPHVYASQIEYMCEHLNKRDCLSISLHPHNDRGCGVADTELGLLAGADRVEGTLFGNGERTGNVDIITLALNMYSHGVDPKLNFENIPEIVEIYERVTRMRVYERQPYSGELVFAAFSGSHQDAIAKGVKWREDNKCETWTVPYLPIDPKDIGREYEADVIRINSQSGKGGIGYLLEQKYGFNLPPKMREDFGYVVKSISDQEHKELMPNEIYEIFKSNYLNISNSISVTETNYKKSKESVEETVVVSFNGEDKTIIANGNGRLDAVSNAIKQATGLKFNIISYNEHSLETGSHSVAVSYVGISTDDNRTVWGAGTDTDIFVSSFNAFISAINRAL